MALRAILLVAFMLFAAASLVNGTSGECLVKKYVELTDTTDTRILSFIKLDKHLDFILQFKDHDVADWRDWVELANSKVTHSKVRDGISNKTTYNLPLVFGEGWNDLLLKAVGTRFELTLLSRDRDEATLKATLLDLQMDFPIYSVHMEGIFALCAEGSPEWEVDEGEKVSVLLQPENSQQLQVTSRGLAKPYLEVPSEHSNRKDISPNTTLTIVTRRQRSVLFVKVFQDDQETLVDVEQLANSLNLVMGCRSGSLHLRLDLSTPSAQNESLFANSSNLTFSWSAGLLLFCGGMIFGSACLAGVMVLPYWRMKAKKSKASCEAMTSQGKGRKGGAILTNPSEKKLLPV